MEEKAREFIKLLRSNIPDDREKAAVMIYQEGMLTHKRLMQASGGKPDEKQTA